jgi:hypothetical protein
MNSFTNKLPIGIRRFALSKILSLWITSRPVSILRPYIDSHGQLFALTHRREQLTRTINLTFTLLPVCRVENAGKCRKITTQPHVHTRKDHDQNIFVYCD